MRKLVHASLAIALLALFARPAAAQEEEFNKDTWPLAINMRPLTLAAGMLELRGDTLAINLSDGAVADPMLIAPGIYYGVNNKLSVGITHQRGVCIGDSCAKTYNDITLDSLYGFMVKGSVQAALHVGFALPSLSDPLIGGLNLGILTRLGSGKLALVLDPHIYVGILERDSLEEFIFVPARIQMQVNGQTNAFVSTGINGPLDGFGDAYTVPVGLGATFAVNNRLDFGAEFVFTNLGGKQAPGAGRADERWLIARLALRL